MTAMLTKSMLCTSKMLIDCQISFKLIGSSKKLRQEAMCVVNKNFFIESKTVTSNEPIMVKRIMIPMVETIGPIEFSAKADRQIEREDTVSKAKYATIKLQP